MTYETCHYILRLLAEGITSLPSDYWPSWVFRKDGVIKDVEWNELVRVNSDRAVKALDIIVSDHLIKCPITLCLHHQAFIAWNDIRQLTMQTS